jgi:hypothetical protein
MPPGSEAAGPGAGDVPGLPRTFRPFGVRIAILATGVVLLLVVAVMWLALPADVRAQFTALQILTLLLLGAMFYAAGFALARSRLVARDDGLTVVNGYRTRRYHWNEVLAVTLRHGSPWAELDISDGTTVSAMGIQGSDGARAQAHVRELRTLVDRLTR